MVRTTAKKQATLQKFEINDQRPGSILRDFEMLLDYLGDHGVRSSGKYHLLPMKDLVMLDEQMTCPLRLEMKRPQQRSFPHLHGLYLLLRATQLAVAEGADSSGKLVRNPEVYLQWKHLNPTEKYFNLVEAWWRLATTEVIGDRCFAGEMMVNAVNTFERIPPEGITFDKQFPFEHLCYSLERQMTLALLELFGFVKVDRGRVSGKGWNPTAVSQTAEGKILMPFLVETCMENLSVEDLDADSQDKLGVWQPAVQGVFPEWQNNLQFPEPEFREGVHVFKVSLGDIWRRIAIPAELTLEDLAQEIISAYDFDGDHLHAFLVVGPNGRKLDFMCPNGADDCDAWTDETAIGYLPLAERGTMTFWYDFGADWKFAVMLEKIDLTSKIRKAKVVESQGKAPPEYDYGFDDADEW